MDKLANLATLKTHKTIEQLRSLLEMPGKPCDACGSPSLCILHDGSVVCRWCHPKGDGHAPSKHVAFRVQLVLDALGTPRMREAGQALREASHDADDAARATLAFWEHVADEFDAEAAETAAEMREMEFYRKRYPQLSAGAVRKVNTREKIRDWPPMPPSSLDVPVTTVNREDLSDLF